MGILLVGWAVILIALIVVIGPLIWLGNRREPIVPRPFYDWDTAEITTSIAYTDSIIVGEPMILDTRTVDDPDEVHDVLGSWKPWEHTPSEPVLLGHTLSQGTWATFGTEERQALVR